MDRAELLEHTADTPGYSRLARARGTRKSEVHVEGLCGANRANNEGNEQRLLRIF